MKLGTQRNLNQSEHIEVCLDQELVQMVKKQKLLGVIIDDTLSWDDQVKWSVSISHEESLYPISSSYQNILIKQA